MKRRRIKRNPPIKLDFSMAKAGDKYIGELEFQKKDGDFDVWTVIKRGRMYLIGTPTNTGLLSDYYYKMEAGESEQNALQEINDDLEAMAQGYGPSAMARIKRIPRKISPNRRRGLRRNESTNKYEMRFTPRSTGIFVWMTDKFMSGWGQARGKINKLIIRCDTLEQAECIFKNAQMREEMKNINYGRKLPYFSESKYKLSFKTWDQLGYVWKTGCKWQNEDDYYSDPGRMRY